MGKTYLHREIAAFRNGGKISRRLSQYFDRKNFDFSYIQTKTEKKKSKQREIELRNELNSL